MELPLRSEGFQLHTRLHSPGLQCWEVESPEHLAVKSVGISSGLGGGLL